MSYRARFLFIAVVLLLTATAASAQDTHYWNNQYGPRAMLLGGIVIGSVSDMSATYYNPGALGYIEKPEVILSANVYQRSTLTVKNGAGDDIDLKSSDLNPLPNLLAGAFRFKWLGNNKLAYSVLTRHRFKTDIGGAQIARVDILDSSAGMDDDFAGAVRVASNVKDLWIGLSWGREFGERIGVGVTQFVSYRQQETDASLLAQALSDAGDFAAVYDIENYRFDQYSLLWKAGFSIDLRPLTFGVVVTTPNVDIAGSGDASVNATIAGIDLDSDGNPDNTFEADVQNNVPSKAKTPLSIGAGGAYHFGRTRLHTAVEWFGSIEPYDALMLDDFVSQGTGQTVTRQLRDARQSVTNFGFGLEHDFNERNRGYLSFVTDYSASDSRSEISITGYDIFHLAGGAQLTRGRAAFTLGLAYAFGKETIPQLIELNPGEGESVIDPDRNVDLVYRRATFIFGFSLGLDEGE